MFRTIALVMLICPAALAANKAPAPTPTVTESAATLPFQFRNAEAVDVLQAYSKMTGQKFVIDGNVHGKITIINPHKVSSEEAFNLLSSGLATNGLAISQQGDTMVVSHARSVQRNMIPVVTELPAAKPERMISWVIDLHNIDANEVNRQLRLLTSSQGELMAFGKNKLIIQDFTSNLYRVRDIIAQIDKPGYEAPKETVEKK